MSNRYQEPSLLSKIDILCKSVAFIYGGNLFFFLERVIFASYFCHNSHEFFWGIEDLLGGRFSFFSLFLSLEQGHVINMIPTITDYLSKLFLDFWFFLKKMVTCACLISLCRC